MNKRRASLEKCNATAESLAYRRRPKSQREASERSTAGERRGIGDGMSAKEPCVNTGDPVQCPRELWQPEAREGKTGLEGESERPIVAKKRLIIVESRGLGTRAMPERARAWRLT